MGNSSTRQRSGSSRTKDGGGGSKLFTLIDDEEWSKVKARIIQKPDEVRQWKTLNLYGCDRKVLPLHLACTLNPPEAVIQTLLDVYPVSSQLLTKSFLSTATVTNSAFVAGEREDWLALQIAVHFKASPVVIEALLLSFPMAAYIRNRAGRLPLHTVCKTDLELNSISIGAIPVIVKLLLRAFPASSIMTSENGLTPIGYVNSKNPPGFTTSIQLLQEKMEILKVLQIKIDDYENDPLPETTRSIMWNRNLLESSPERKVSSKCFKLYEHLLRKEWGEAISRCKKYPKEAAIWMSDESYQYDRLPLHKACDSKAPLELVKVLVDAYPDGVQAKEKHDMLPIHISVHRKADIDILRYLIKIYPMSLWVRDSFGLLPLHIACTEGSPLASIELLLMNAPDSMYVRDKRGYTASMYSQKSMFPHRVAVLEALGQNPLFWRGKCQERTYNQNGEIAANRSLYDLVSSSDWESACMRAKSFPVEAKLWIKDGDSYGKLPLHKCIEQNPPLKVVKALCSAFPAGILEKGKQDMLPIHIAIENKASDEVVEYLLRQNPEAAMVVDSSGRLPIVIGSITGMSESTLTSLLFAYPESVLLPYPEGKTPISYIEASNHWNKEDLLEILTRSDDELKAMQVTQSITPKISDDVMFDSMVVSFTSGWTIASVPVPDNDKSDTVEQMDKENEQTVVSHVETMNFMNVDDFDFDRSPPQVSGKRLAKLKAIRSTAGNETEIKELKPKPIQLARRSRQPPRSPQIRQPIPEESEFTHREIGQVKKTIESFDEASIDASELTESVTNEPYTEKTDVINTAAQFLMSDWKSAEVILNGKPTSYKQLVGRKSST